MGRVAVLTEQGATGRPEMAVVSNRSSLVGDSLVMRALRGRVELAAAVTSTVLLQGESGRGGVLGLGLSIVRGICRTLEYRLTLVSEPQRELGTELRVEVPLGDVTKVIAPVRLKPAADPGLKGRCVLMLDDEKDVRDGMRTPLCAEASVLLSTCQ